MDIKVLTHRLHLNVVFSIFFLMCAVGAALLVIGQVRIGSANYADIVKRKHRRRERTHATAAAARIPRCLHDPHVLPHAVHST